MYRYFLFLFLPFSVWGQTQSPDKAFASTVKQEFTNTWKTYKEKAWKSDALKPITKKGYEVYYKSFHLTALESYSTLLLMGMQVEADEVKELLLKELKFKKFVLVPVGEFGGRVLSALLSAYQHDGDKRFLELSIDLANRLLPAFNTKTGMPYRLISLASLKGKEYNNSPNQIAGLLSEYGLLSSITGNPIYYATAKKAVVALWDTKSEEGLLGSKVDVSTGKWVNSDTNVSLGISGFFSSVLHAYLLTGDEELKEIWTEGTQSIQEHLSYEFKGTTGFGYSSLNDLTKRDSILRNSEVLYAGLLAEAGKENQAEAFYKYYEVRIDSLVLAPEYLNFRKPKKSRYINKLYSEQIEACFLLYIYTGNSEYLTVAKNLFAFLQKNCTVKNAYCGLRDVRKLTKYDQMPPRLLAKWFKYMYLMAGDHSWNVEDMVFSASGQPLLLPAK